jgi:hypothetical protein
VILLASLAASAAEPFGEHVFFVGDLHAHTGISGDAEDSTTCEACGSTLGAFDTARTNGLDFVAVTDHVNGGPAANPAEWAASLDRALDADAPDEGFVTIPAAEVFVVGRDGHEFGHKTLLLFGGNEELQGLTTAEVSPSGTTNDHVPTCDELWAWATRLGSERGPLALIPHHPTAGLPMATDWTCHSDVWQPAVEVYSIHGNGLGDGSGFDPVLTEEIDSGSARHALDAGIQLGFLGGTDRHDTLPGEVCVPGESRGDAEKYGGGLTIVVLDENEAFDRAAVGRAISERRTLATSGPVLPVSIVWSTSLGDVGLGGEVTRVGDEPIVVNVSVPDEYHTLVLGVEAVTSAGTVSLSAVDGVWQGEIVSDVTWAYVRVGIDGETWWDAGCDDAGDDTAEYLWSSPSFVTVLPSETDTETGGRPQVCGTVSSATPSVAALFALALLFRRRSG